MKHIYVRAMIIHFRTDCLFDDEQSEQKKTIEEVASKSNGKLGTKYEIM